MQDEEVTEAEPAGEAASETETETETSEPETTPTEEPKVRRGRGNLEADVKAICDAYAQGDIVLAEGEFLTPHRIGKFISERNSEPVPSTGAVAAALKRWVDYGYAVVNEKNPFAFVDFTDAARTEGLSALKAKYKGVRKAEKAEASGSSEPAEATHVDEPAVETPPKADETDEGE